MLATTWVQIIKAALLMVVAVFLSILVLAEVGWNPVNLFNQAAAVLRRARPSSRRGCS